MKFLTKSFFYTLFISASLTFNASATDPVNPTNPLTTTTTAPLMEQMPVAIDGDTQIDDMLTFAKKFRGVPYRYGQSSPRGFDCSGFTSYVYKAFGYKLHRTASGQVANGKRVDRSNLKPGDLVFFSGRGGGPRVGHVGIVTSVDDNAHDFSFIHASCNKGITISHSSESYYRVRYRTACRVITDPSDFVPSILEVPDDLDLAQIQ